MISECFWERNPHYFVHKPSWFIFIVATHCKNIFFYLHGRVPYKRIIDKDYSINKK